MGVKAKNIFFLNLPQTLSEDDLREVTPAESIAEGSELNESFIFHSKNNGKLEHRLPQKGNINLKFYFVYSIINTCFL